MSIELAWYLLYKEDYDTTPDPNKPENTAYINAKREEHKKEMQLFMRGPGKVLFKMLEKKMKDMNLTLFSINPDDFCKCRACETIREMQSIMKLWMAAETAMKE